MLSTRRAGSTWLGLVLGSHAWARTLGGIARVTFPQHGGMVCRLCEADGKPGCNVLGNLSEIPPERLFTVAAERMASPMLIDVSKWIDWTSRFLGRDDVDVRIVHLVRHPLAYVDSEMRRDETSPENILARWSTENQAIERFAESAGVPHVLVSYERLAATPEIAFPPLCAFLGYEYDPNALAYWETAHHGFGANGASSLYLRGRSVQRFVTGDDAFYADLVDRPTQADRRWEARVPDTLGLDAVNSPYARRLARRLGFDEWTIPARA